MLQPLSVDDPAVVHVRRRPPDAVRNGNAMCETSTSITDDVVTLEACQQGDAWVIALHGELDLSSRQIVHDAFAEAVVRACDRVEVDASRVTFMDCGGLRVLLTAADAFGGEVCLRSPSPPVQRIAELVGLGLESGEVRFADRIRR